MSSQLTELVTALAHKTIYNCMILSAISILIYDFCLTIHLEIELIWFSSWNYTKILFLLVRYLPLVLVLIILSPYYVTMTEGTCRVLAPIPSWLLMTEIVLAEAILAIRTWAIWGRNRIVSVILAVAAVATVVTMSVVTGEYYKIVQYGDSPIPGARGCHISKLPGRSLWVPFAALTIFEAIVLALISTSAFLSSRSGDIGELSKVVHRDGILSYVYLLIVSVANLIAMFLAPLDLMTILAPLELALYVVLTSRVVLTIRNMTRRDEVDTQFYTRSDSPYSMTSLRFSDGVYAEDHLDK